MKRKGTLPIVAGAVAIAWSIAWETTVKDLEETAERYQGPAKSLVALGRADRRKIQIRGLDQEKHFVTLQTHNGTEWPLRKLVVEITVTEADGQISLKEEYDLETLWAIPPGTTGEIYAFPKSLPKPGQHWSFRIVAATCEK